LQSYLALLQRWIAFLHFCNEPVLFKNIFKSEGGSMKENQEDARFITRERIKQAVIF
jgi:hypothetical protein